MLLYSARSQTRPLDDDAPEGQGEPDDRPRLAWVAAEGRGPVVRASRRGKPLAQATVKVFRQEGETSEVVTDADGRVVVPGLADGKMALLLRVVDRTAGEREGRPYAEVRHYATLTISPAAVATAAADDPGSADEWLQRAHDARACWGPGFPGFTADIVVRGETQAVRGTVRVSPEGAVELDLPDGAAKDWAGSQLRSLVRHRGLDGPTRLEPGASFAEPPTDHPLGRLIRLADDRMGSTYRIKDDEIREVNRTTGRGRFSNRILANVRNAEGKLLPLAYSVTYWDDSGAVQWVEVVHDTWVRVGKLDLPRTHTQITSGDGKSPVWQMELSGHRLGTAEDRAAATSR